MNVNLKHGFFTSEIFLLVVFGECHFELVIIASFQTDQTFFKTRNKLLRANGHRCFFSGTAFECFFAELTDEINHDLIAIGGLALFGGEILGRLGQVVQRVLHIVLRRGDDHLLKAQRFVVHLGDFGQLFIGHGDGLGPGDKGYKRMKKLFTNPIAKWFFRWLHPDLGVRIARYFSIKNKLISGEDDIQFLGDENEWLVQWHFAQ